MGSGRQHEARLQAGEGLLAAPIPGSTRPTSAHRALLRQCPPRRTPLDDQAHLPTERHVSATRDGADRARERRLYSLGPGIGPQRASRAQSQGLSPHTVATQVSQRSSEHDDEPARRGPRRSVLARTPSLRRLATSRPRRREADDPCQTRRRGTRGKRQQSRRSGRDCLRAGNALERPQTKGQEPWTNSTSLTSGGGSTTN